MVVLRQRRGERGTREHESTPLVSGCIPGLFKQRHWKFERQVGVGCNRVGGAISPATREELCLPGGNGRIDYFGERFVRVLPLCRHYRASCVDYKQ